MAAGCQRTGERYMLQGKTVLLGVTGGIAAYKAAQFASDLKKLGADVHVIMTRNATEFVTPLTFETLTGNRACIDTFDRNFSWEVEHVSLAKKADVFVVAPATANVIAKFAFGICDDMLTTTFLAASCPKVVAPAMNNGMYRNPATQASLQTLRDRGMALVGPDSGFLACGDEDIGRLCTLGELMHYTVAAVTPQDLQGLHVLVTAGPTREAADPVRFMTNYSSGRQGYEIARAAALRGADVTLVSGPTALEAPAGVTFIPTQSALQMFEAVSAKAGEQDIIIKAAAVADFRPQSPAAHKIKKGDTEAPLTLVLERNPDILAWLGQHKKPGQVLVGFAMETDDLLANAEQKRVKKNADFIVANSLVEEGAGFGGTTNVVTLLTAKGAEKLPKMDKFQLGQEILNRAKALWQGQDRKDFGDV